MGTGKEPGRGEGERVGKSCVYPWCAREYHNTVRCNRTLERREWDSESREGGATVDIIVLRIFYRLGIFFALGKIRQYNICWNTNKSIGNPTLFIQLLTYIFKPIIQLLHYFLEIYIFQGLLIKHNKRLPGQRNQAARSKNKPIAGVEWICV